MNDLGALSSTLVASSTLSAGLLVLFACVSCLSKHTLPICHETKMAVLVSIVLFPLQCMTFDNPFTGAAPTLWNLPAYTLAYDFCYYVLHRLHHRFWTPHFKVHHKPLKNPFQAGEFDALEIFTIHSVIFGLKFLFPLPISGFMAFFLLYTMQSFLIHTGWSLDYPIFVSPSDHNAHHTYHHYNFATILKLYDQVFGTYRPMKCAKAN